MKRAQKKQIIRDAGQYSVGAYLAEFIGLFTSIIIKRALGPTLVGIWTGLKVLLNYCLYGNMGVGPALFKEVPYLVGRGELKKAEETKNIIFTFTLFMGIVIALILVIGSFFLMNRYPAEVIMGIRVTGIIILLTLVYNFYLTVFRAYKNFSALSKLILIDAVSMLLFTVLFVFKFKLYGLYAAVCASIFVTILYASLNSKIMLSLRIDMKRLAYIIRLGLSLVLWSMALNLLLSIDRIIAIKFLGPEALGYYSIAIMAFGFCFGSAKRFGTVMFPRMQEAYAANPNAGSLERFIISPNETLSFLLVILLGSCYLFIPAFVHYVLPRYKEGIEASKILLAGCFFISLVPAYYNFMIAIDRQLKLIVITVFACAATTVLNLITLNMLHGGINGIAAATSASYLIFFLALSYHVFIHFTISKFILHFVNIFVPFFVSLAALIIMDKFIAIQNLILAFFVKESLFLLVLLPFMWHLNKKTGIVTDLYEWVISFLKAPFMEEKIMDETGGNFDGLMG